MPVVYDPNSGWSVYRRLLSYAFPYWKIFVFTTLAMLVYASTETGFAAMMKPLLDGSFVNKDPVTIKWLPLLLIGLFLVRGISDFVSTYGMKWIGREVVTKVRGEMFAKLLRLPTTYYDRQSSGMIVSRLTFNVEQIANSITNAVNLIVKDTFTVIGLIAWMFYISGWLALLFLVVGPVIAVLVVYISKRFRRISHNVQRSMGEVTQSVEQIIDGQRVIKSFGGQAHEEQAFNKVNLRNAHLRMKIAATDAFSVPFIQFLAACMLAAVIYIATSEAMLEELSVGSFMSFMAAMLLLMPPLKRLTRINSTLQAGIAAGQSIFALLDAETEVDSGSRPLQRASGQVVFDNVSFHYNDTQGPVLNAVSFDVQPGQTIAIVGRSGSGKSTLINLLSRFYDVSNGRILLDGVDIREYRLEDLRAQIAMVSQQVVLFNDTIARNIAYGSLENADPARIEAAAVAAHAMEFIRTLPEGLDTLVGENGVLLSGGQRQRLAIARALLKDAPLLVLDEATSALDTESERAIQAALEELMKSRTTLVIAHRLSTVEKADCILVMDQGRIVESGTHAELLQRGGHYAGLYNMQFRDTPPAAAGPG